MVISFFDNPYKITTGFFLENTIVVAEGEMLAEGIFQVLVNISFVISASCSLNFCKTNISNIRFLCFYTWTLFIHEVHYSIRFSCFYA